jgi:hypothetical protein
MEQEGGADNCQSDDCMQRKRTSEVDAETFAQRIVIAVELDESGYGAPSSLLQRLGDDADVGDASLLDGIHYRGEGSERDSLVGTKIDDAFGWIAFAGGPQLLGKVVHVDWFVLQEDVLLFVDCDDHSLFGELIDGACLGNSYLDSGLQDWSSQHEDEKEHEDNVNQRSYVDLCQCCLSVPFGGEGHR